MLFKVMFSFCYPLVIPAKKKKKTLQKANPDCDGNGFRQVSAVLLIFKGRRLKLDSNI